MSLLIHLIDSQDGQKKDEKVKDGLGDALHGPGKGADLLHADSALLRVHSRRHDASSDEG
jgi:hypothetical protein